MHPPTSTAKAHGLALALLLVAIGAGGCSRRESPPTAGSVRVTAVAAALSPDIARVVLVVSPGGGSSFSPMRMDLVRGQTAWTAFVTGIPAGAQRQFQVFAYDATGAEVARGEAYSDVVPGSTTVVVIRLERAPPPILRNHAPIIDYLTASKTTARTGEVLRFGASAHDQDPQDTITYHWSATCGGFDDADRSFTFWTAPGTEGTCKVTITVTDNHGAATSRSIDITVVSGTIAGAAGTRMVTFWPDPPALQVTAPAPDVATASAPSALVQSGGTWSTLPGGHLAADGSFVPGTMGADGSFVIPGAFGAYVLSYVLPGGVQAYVDTSATEVDLGYDVLGRPDQASPASPLLVSLALTGLDPWNPIWEQVQLTSSNANLSLTPNTFGALLGGDTSGTLSVSWMGQDGLPLNRVQSGDTVFLHQLSTRSITSGDQLYFYSAATHATPAPPDPAALTTLALPPGGSFSLARELPPLPLSAGLDVAWSPPAFEVSLPAMGPSSRTSAGPRAHALVVGASAFPLAPVAPPQKDGTPALVVFVVPAGTPQLAGTLYYGRFLSSLWNEWRGTTFRADVTYLAAGATNPLVETASLVRRDALPVAAGTIVPGVTPVRLPLVNGADALTDQASVTGTPLLSWLPPATGSPTAYLVQVYELKASGPSSVSAEVLRYATSATAVTIPPGVLAAGATYYARITALVAAVPLDSAPFRAANVYQKAETLTGLFTP
jgi:hypothetical protein